MFRFHEFISKVDTLSINMTESSIAPSLIVQKDATMIIEETIKHTTIKKTINSYSAKIAVLLR